MTSPKKIVVVSGLRIFPAQTGGHLHTATIAASLARLGHSVTVCSLAGRREDYGTKERSLCVAVEPGLTEEVYLDLWQGLLQTLARRLGLPRVWQYWLIARGWVPETVKRRLQEADVIFSDLPYVPPVPGIWRNKPWYLISHNLEHKLLAIGGRNERRFVAWMRSVEAAAPARYRDICACALEDHSFFREHDPEERCAIPVVGSAADPAAYEFNPESRARVRAELGVADDERLIVFSGSRFGPNLQPLADLKAFCAAEADFLAQRRIRFLILGSIESMPYREGALIATGRVDRIPPFLNAADAGLNPVTTGSGANVKLFEYLAARLPVISTRFGVRGTELAAGIDYLEIDAANFKQQLAAFVDSRTVEAWRTHAEEVWNRHRHYADIGEVVRRAVTELRDFPH